jgi:hypothetical protein
MNCFWPNPFERRSSRDEGIADEVEDEVLFEKLPDRPRSARALDLNPQIGPLFRSGHRNSVIKVNFVLDERRIRRTREKAIPGIEPDMSGPILQQQP